MRYTRLLTIDDGASVKEIKRKKDDLLAALPGNIINRRWISSLRIYPGKVSYVLEADIT